MSLNGDVSNINELWTRVHTNHSTRDRSGLSFLDRVYLSMEGHPKAAAWDNGPRSADVICDLHECDIRMCHQEGLGCVGYPHSHPSDPTGETGARMAQRGDAAADVEREYRNRMSRILRDVLWCLNAQDKYPPTREPNAYERQQTATENDPHCESHSRIEIAKGVPWWVDPHVNGSKNFYKTTVNGVLPEPMWLCKLCLTHVAERGCLPSEDELEQHRAGKRIRCPHAVIPKPEEAA